jgi:hypothetical protein
MTGNPLMNRKAGAGEVGAPFRKITWLEKALIRLRFNMILFTTSVWANTVALLANPMFWAVVGTAFLLFSIILYYRWQKFRDIVDEVNHYIQKYFFLLGDFGWTLKEIDLLVKLFKFLAQYIGAATDALKELGRAFKGIWDRIASGGNWINKHLAIPGHHHFATGGVMSYTGQALVGERGPEIVTLPKGARVTPMGQMTLAGAGAMSIKVYPQSIFLDGKKIAEVIATAVTDKQARA